MSNKSKVIIITGTSSGIGKTLAEYFQKKGHIVYGFSRTAGENEIFKHIKTDISDKENVKHSVQAVFDIEKRIDILINNAGVGMLGPVEDAEKSELDKLLGVNFFGALYMIQEVLPIMRNQKKGHILSVSSIASNSGLPFRGFYSASKSALDRVIESVRMENLNTGIEICTLNLGDIQTNIAESRVKSKVSDFYLNIYNHISKDIDKEVDKGTKPEDLIPIIERLLHKKNLKPHYYIGKPLQKFSITLKNILPQKWFEKMMIKYSNL